jgi:hypothetical protein
VDVCGAAAVVVGAVVVVGGTVVVVDEGVGASVDTMVEGNDVAAVVEFAVSGAVMVAVLARSPVAAPLGSPHADARSARPNAAGQRRHLSVAREGTRRAGD